MVAPALAALVLAGCPHDATLGNVTFARAGHEHVVSLGDCRDRVVGRARRAAVAHVRGVVVRGSTLWARHNGKLVRLTQPLPSGHGMRSWPEPVSRSPDGRYVVWFRATNSASISADGLELEVTPLAGGRTHKLGSMLAYRDYLTWCGSKLVFVGGGIRQATTNKRLLVAQAPDWKPRPVWNAPHRAFSSVACAPDERSVAVLSQPSSNAANFFHTRWQLWRVALDGSRRLIDKPPAATADASPQWSRDGRSLLFVRERRGYGRLMLWRDGRVTGPIVSLGYGLGYYGHQDWSASMGWSLGVKQR
jgi:hypothetical protein